jgi:hypothetical protein
MARLFLSYKCLQNISTQDLAVKSPMSQLKKTIKLCKSFRLYDLERTHSAGYCNPDQMTNIQILLWVKTRSGS